jgi:phosphohistidine phosphatase
MDLYLMRHGIAVQREGSQGGPDAERSLTDEGLRKTEQVAQGLARLGVAVDWIITSPLARARETAEIAARALGLEDRVQEWPELGAGGSNESLLGRLRAAEHDKSFEGVLLVGHEPQLSELASLLLSGTRDLSIDFKKAGVCSLQVGGTPKWGSATLRWFLTPKHLRLLGQS